MQLTWHRVAVFAAFLVTLQALALFIFGQPLFCTCGYVKLWEGVVVSMGNSQHIADWYTFSHFIHGLIFYAALGFFFPKVPVRVRFLAAVGLEVGWEVLENTPMVIEHYRQQALAAGYTGDSILNSVSDTLAMMLGFLWAARMPLWSSVVAALGLELWVGYSIRDNLTLNVINLVHQFDFIKNWQSGM